jgi:hypothetical protein
MTPYLIAIAFVLLLLAEWPLSSFGFENPKKRRPLLVAGLAAGLGIVLAFQKLSPSSEYWAWAIGAFLGALTALFGSFTKKSLAGYGFGLLVAAGTGLAPHALLSPTIFAGLVSAGVISWCLDSDSATASLVGLFVASMPNLIATKHGDAAAQTQIGTIIALIGYAGAVLANRIPRKLSWLRPLLIEMAVLGGAEILQGSLGQPNLISLAGIGLSVGIVVWFLPREGEDSRFSLALSSVLGLAMITVAHGLDRNAGIAISLVGLVAILALDQRLNPFSIVGPLAALLLIYFVKGGLLESAKELEVGSLYSLIGLVVGIALPMLVRGHSERVSWKDGVYGFSWSAILFASVPLALLVFSVNGAVGMVLGLGVSAWIQGFTVGPRRQSLSLVFGLGALFVLMVGLKPGLTGFGRNERIRILSFAGGGLVVLGGIQSELVRSMREEGKS